MDICLFVSSDEPWIECCNGCSPLMEECGDALKEELLEGDNKMKDSMIIIKKIIYNIFIIR